VALAKPADVSAGSLTAMTTALQALSANTASTPYTIVLTGISFTDMGNNLNNLWTALQAGGKAGLAYRNWHSCFSGNRLSNT
jgi:hypothetical protein